MLEVLDGVDAEVETLEVVEDAVDEDEDEDESVPVTLSPFALHPPKIMTAAAKAPMMPINHFLLIVLLLALLHFLQRDATVCHLFRQTFSASRK